MKKKERRILQSVDKKYGLPKGFTELLKKSHAFKLAKEKDK